MILTAELPSAESIAAGDLVVSRVDDGIDRAPLREEWNELAGDVPFRKWEWLEAWWRHFARPGDQLFLLCVRGGDGRLVGLAPWYLGNSVVEGGVIRFLGSGRVCSDYLTILSAAGWAQQVAERVADWMIDESDRVWDVIALDGVADDDAALAALVQRMEARGFRVHRQAGLNCWRMALPDDWESYLKSLSKSRRERVRQLHRRQFDTGRALVHRVQSANELKRAFEILVDLHQRRRLSLGEPGCFSEPRFTKFLDEAAERFLKLGQLRLQWVELEGRPVAAQIDFSGGGSVYHYQSGIDPGIPRERPGWLGTSSALKSAIEQGFAEFDFLRGDEEYKSHWRAEAVPLHDIRIAGQFAASNLRHQLWRVQNSLKNWVKKRIGRA